jgi:hypothetical protein
LVVKLEQEKQRMILRAVMAALCLSLNFQAFAYDAKTLKAMDGVQSELSHCIGYFTIVKQCIGNQDAKLSETTQQVIHLVGERAIKLGLDIGMSNEAIVARSATSKEEQLALMQRNCATIKPVVDRYENRCKEVLLHQDAVLKEYLAR